MAQIRKQLLILLLSTAAIAPVPAVADPFIEPGRIELRSDLQTLADAGIVTGPTTAWPISWQSVLSGLDNTATAALSPTTRAAFERIEAEGRFAAQTGRVQPHLRLGGISDTLPMRSFADRPRAEGEIEAGISYTSDRFTFNIDLTRAINSSDDWRLDGSYVGFATRRWAFIAGYPERWWGPGIQGSLILSNNARPVPQLGVERISTDGFQTRWLRWIGPWTVSTFIGELDDDRVIQNAKLFGIRMTARPLPQLEVGFSRTAQLCGDGRECNLSVFLNMLAGRDNQGRNVSAEDEPGNQLAGLDGRWSFTDRPFAVYWQWIGEDSRQGGPQVGSWMRLVGAEFTSSFAASSWQQRTYFEMADTTCQQGGGGFGGNKFNCGYEHSTYRSGMRYEGLPLGHTTDSDSESYALISVLNGPEGQSWDFGAYSARINQGPVTSLPHSISQTPASRYGVEVGHLRELPLGHLRVRVSLAEQRDQLTGATTSDSSIALEWMVGYW